MSCNYDIYLIWALMRRCNFSCEYCIASASVLRANKAQEPIAPVDSTKAVQVLNATGKTFRIGLTGGEPFLVPNFIELCHDLTQQHYISINTNLSVATDKIRALIDAVPRHKISVIMVSAHLDELVRRSLMSRLIDNVHVLQQAGINMAVMSVVHPEHVNKFLYWRDIFKKEGIVLLAKEIFGTYNEYSYPNGYTDEQLNKLGINRISLSNYSPYGKPCCAGYNAARITCNGDIEPCAYIREPKLGNIYKEINLSNAMRLCPMKICACPYRINLPALQANALKKCKLPPIIAPST